MDETAANQKVTYSVVELAASKRNLTSQPCWRRAKRAHLDAYAIDPDAWQPVAEVPAG